MTWAETGLELLLHRVEVTEGQVAGRFPLYADASTGEWTTTRRGAWTGGFWAGLLSLRAAATGSPAHEDQARLAWETLWQWRDKDTSCRGLIFWYGSLGQRWQGKSADVVEAASALASAYDSDLGLVPWGSAFGGAREMARVDGVAGLVPLLGWAAQQEKSPELAAVANGHLSRHLQLCIVDGLVQPALVPAGQAWRPHSPPGSGWSRGMAWLLLACADGAYWLAPEFLPPAVELAKTWTRRFGSPVVPPADTGHGDGVLDSSAAAIAAVALLKLSALTGEQNWWDMGEATLRVLDACLVTSGPARGAVAHGCYELASGVATDHELVWGDFFCAAGLGMLTGLVGPFGV